MSETLMFHSEATQPVHSRSIGLGVVGTASPAPEVLINLAKERFPYFARREDLQVNPNRLSGSLYFAAYNKGSSAVSITLGLPVAGIDVTQQLWRGTYLTVAVSAPGQIQSYLQHRAYNSSDLGLVFGVGYRRDVYTFDPPTECLSCLNFDHIWVDSFGVRSISILRGSDEMRGGIRFGVYAGYASILKQPIIGFSLALGRF